MALEGGYCVCGGKGCRDVGLLFVKWGCGFTVYGGVYGGLGATFCGGRLWRFGGYCVWRVAMEVGRLLFFYGGWLWRCGGCSMWGGWKLWGLLCVGDIEEVLICIFCRGAVVGATVCGWL